MISFKKFIDAIHDAVLGANDALLDQNEGFLERFFVEEENDGPDGQPDPDKTTLRAKTVALEYPRLGNEGSIETIEVMVPLVTLVPLNQPQIEKVKMSAEFQISVMNDEVQLNFPKRSGADPKPETGIEVPKTVGTLEITMAPGQTPDGLRELVEGYEKVLKAQIPG